MYFLTQRCNATSFYFLDPMIDTSRYHGEWREQFAREMAISRPLFFIMLKDGYPWVNAPAETVYKAAKPVLDYVEANDKYIGESTVFLLYERK